MANEKLAEAIMLNATNVQEVLDILDVRLRSEEEYQIITKLALASIKSILEGQRRLVNLLAESMMQTSDSLDRILGADNDG